MTKCWAACIGNCSNSGSREHILTKGLFPDIHIRVKGFSWCLNEFKMVGIGSLTKNVLCRNHNSMLSETDACAIALRDAVRGVVDLTAAREPFEPRAWNIERFLLNGPMLERWLLKTLMTLAIDHEAPIGRAAFRAGEAPRPLVKIAFGLKTFKPRAGLYWVGDTGKRECEEGYEIATFTDRDYRVAGARFQICGLEFMLILDSNRPLVKLPPHTCYRPEVISFSVHGISSHAIQFDW